VGRILVDARVPHRVEPHRTDPYESSYEAVAGLERTTLSATDPEKITHGNAERLLRIS
jgi:hypothetical protein